MLRTLKFLLVVVVVMLIAGGLVIRGIGARIKAAASVKQETMDLAVPTVAVTHAKRGGMKDELVLSGNIQAFVDAPVYARTSGYLKKWYFDIGAPVKNGQLLADIESPEVDQQLSQARADYATAQANLKLSEINMNRYQALWKLDSIAKQDLDNAVGSYEALKATLASQEANVKRLEQLVSFEKVFAPFDGVITARNTDVGQLINAGNGGAAQSLFQISSTDKLRIFISVPQMYSNLMPPGTRAELTLTESPGRHYFGKIARNSSAIDPATRTMLTEVDIDNAVYKLLPGAYAEVHLKLPVQSAALIVPVTALIFRAAGLQIATVKDGKANLIPVTLGRDYGTEVEVTSGIMEQDAIVVNPPDSLTNGAPVRVETAADQKP